ncbi:MAG: NADH-quinone oxidoreductase subunit M [Pseudomonadota bacterium]
MYGYLLSLLLIVPLVGAAMLLTIPADQVHSARNMRWTALWTSVFTFALSLMLWFGYDQSNADFQFVKKIDLVPGFFNYYLGVDGISVLLILLTTFLMPICIIASWSAIQDRVREYMIAFLVMETLMIGVFCSLDVFLFYVFFEGGLVPMFLIIGVWGGARRVYASFKFFLYTLTGSLLMLLAMLYIVITAGTSDIPTLLTFDFSHTAQTWLWLAFFASFAVKMPMWPVHTWLPDAHVEAPTAGSVILAGVLLKMGGYGFIRFSLPMFPDASHDLAILVFVMSIIAVIYTSLVALVQQDMKKLIAYSSVAHMGFVTIGLFTFNQQGLEGSIFQMLSHGIVSGALFLCVGVVYDRLHTRMIDRYGGLVNIMPQYALVFMVFTMASVGLPGTSGFVGEFLVLVGAYESGSWIAFGAAIGLILGAGYMLWRLYKNVVFGTLEKDDLKGMLDLSPREWGLFAPMIVLVLWMGIYPKPFLDFIEVPVETLITQMERGGTDKATAQRDDSAPAQKAAAR